MPAGLSRPRRLGGNAKRPAPLEKAPARENTQSPKTGARLLSKHGRRRGFPRHPPPTPQESGTGVGQESRSGSAICPGGRRPVRLPGSERSNRLGALRRPQAASNLMQPGGVLSGSQFRARRRKSCSLLPGPRRLFVRGPAMPTLQALASGLGPHSGNDKVDPDGNQENDERHKRKTQDKPEDDCADGALESQLTVIPFKGFRSATRARSLSRLVHSVNRPTPGRLRPGRRKSSTATGSRQRSTPPKLSPFCPDRPRPRRGASKPAGAAGATP
jgi:hypothetical protein